MATNRRMSERRAANAAPAKPSQASETIRAAISPVSGSRFLVCLAFAISLAASAGENPSAVREPAGLGYWPPELREAQQRYETQILDSIDPKRLYAWHDLSASEPHVAGTQGDLNLVEALAKAFADMGLEVEKHEFWGYLPRPVTAKLEIVSPDPMPLSVKEAPLKEDPYSGHPNLDPGWNGYSGSGDVTAEVVYANRGTRQDFERLGELGVSCRGKIVLARYGGNFRGYKAKFAQAAGAVGLIIYTDPEDNGYGRGMMYPEGGYANPGYIQRGSIKTQAFSGDPLTPFVEATKNAERLDPEEVDLPKIPVQPVGWQAASEIFRRMEGSSVPQEWQGGLPFRYRLTGGEGLRVRLQVEQTREIVKSFNVLATLKGAKYPRERVMLGSHHDAWGFGAVDPTAGLIAVLEAGRVFAEAAERGMRPLRSVTFAAWGAEEQGLIGSVEWVEGNLPEIRDEVVAYFNLDSAATGPDFRVSSAPALQRLIADAAQRVDHPAVPGKTVFDHWLERGFHHGDREFPLVGDLGGGSDHLGFIALGGVPCAGLFAGGSDGSSYHSNYDTLHWYRQVVGDDYLPAALITRMVALCALRLANAPLLPLEPERTGSEARRHLAFISQRGRQNGLFSKDDSREVAVDLVRIEAAALLYEHRAGAASRALLANMGEGGLEDKALDEINRILMRSDRAWLQEEGIPGRPWFQNFFAANDEDSGYAPWMLPALRYAVEHRDERILRTVEKTYLQIFDAMTENIGKIESLVR